MTNISRLQEILGPLIGNKTAPVVSGGLTRRTLMMSLANVAVSLIPGTQLIKDETGLVAKIYTDLPTFKAQPVTNLQATLMSTIGAVGYSWTLGNFSGVDPTLLDTIYIKSDDNALTVGVWRKNSAETVSIKDFGGVGDGTTSDEAAGLVALAYLASRGGGTLHFPLGDYPVKLVIDTPNIKINAEPGTIFRPSGRSTVVDITANGINATVDGPIVTGQTLAQESIPNTGGVQNTSAAYGIRTMARGTVLRNFKTRAARYDGLYIRVTGVADTVVENFDIGPSARNCASIIQGHRFSFSKGTMRQGNEYTNEIGYSGLYLFDHEPNAPTDTFDTIEFNDVEFINEGTTADNWQVMFHTTYLPGDILNAVFNKCRFKKAGAATTSSGIRLAGGAEITFRGITVRDCSFEGRPLSVAGDAVKDVEDSLFENIDLLDTGNFTYGVFLGEGAVVRDVRCSSGSVVIQRRTGITIQNVSGVDDVSPKAFTVSKLEALGGALV